MSFPIFPTIDGVPPGAGIVRGDSAAGELSSADITRRFALWRVWDPRAELLVVIGLNPSKATHEVLDPTVTRLVKRAQRGGHGGLVMLNLLSLRSTDPKGLRGQDPIDLVNANVLRSVMKSAHVGMVIAAWGGPYSPAWLRHLVGAAATVAHGMALQAGRKLHALGVTKDNIPRHPLYLKSDAEPRPWP
jgi:hypothetical protein